MSSGEPLPDALRALFLRPDIGRALRSALDGHQAPALAALVAPGVMAPQCVASWSTLDDGHRVAPLERDDAMAVAGRNAAALGMLRTQPPAGCAWCLYLAAGVAVGVVAFSRGGAAARGRPRERATPGTAGQRRGLRN